VVFEQVCTDLESEGYEVQTYVLSASSQNAPHLRYRCWIVGILADTESQRPFSTSKRGERKQEQSGILNNKKEVRSKVRSKSTRCSELREQDVANSDSERQQEQRRAESIQQEKSWQKERFGLERQSWWSVEPSVGRVANGIPNRVDRLKGLGNAVVPQIPAVLGRAILEVHNE